MLEDYWKEARPALDEAVERPSFAPSIVTQGTRRRQLPLREAFVRPRQKPDTTQRKPQIDHVASVRWPPGDCHVSEKGDPFQGNGYRPLAPN